MAGYYTFKWQHPAEEVFVTGTFDNWTKSERLEKEGDVFQKTVELKNVSEKIYFKFVVDGTWTVNESSPKEADHEGNVNNFISPEDVVKTDPAAAIINTVAPESTTAKMASEQPVETATPSDIPGGFPGTPPTDSDKPVGIDPLPAAAGAVNPIELQPGEKIPDAIATENTNGYVKLDKESYENSDAIPGVESVGDEAVSVNPLPAAVGAINPIKLEPGEKVPDAIAAGNTNEYVKLDKESYEKSDAIPGVEPVELPPVSNNIIPESGLPVVDVKDVTINTVGAGATTLGLAAEVPLESKVPEVVKESQKEAGAEPEASAVPEEVEEKAQVEEELKDKVAEAPATSEGTSGLGTEKSESDHTGVVAAAEEAPAAEPVAKAEPAKEEVPEPSKEAEEKQEEVSPEVPTEVKESIADSGESPEAAVNAAAVEEKKEVEAELLEEVKPAPAVEESKAEEAKPEEASTAAPVAAPVAAEAPATEAPAVEAETTDAPANEVSKVEETKTEVPASEPAAVETSNAEAPVTEAPAAEEVKTEAPTAEAPAAEPVETEASKTETPATETDKTEVPQTETPATEAVAPDAPAVETPKADAPAPAPAPVAAANGSEAKPAEAPATDKKRKNRLSSIFSKIKHKLTDKN